MNKITIMLELVRKDFDFQLWFILKKRLNRRTKKNVSIIRKLKMNKTKPNKIDSLNNFLLHMSYYHQLVRKIMTVEIDLLPLTQIAQIQDTSY